MPRVKHTVLLKFKATTPGAAIAEIMRDLAGLVDVIPGIVNFSGGADISVEGLQQGFTHGFAFTFADVASRDAYLPHPAHEAVKAKILAEIDGVESVVVLDWLVT